MAHLALPGHVRRCCAALRKAGFQAYPVGGCVRDLLLGREPGDWDVTTSALPEDTAALFPRVVLTGARHGTVTVLTEGGPVEVTTFRADGTYSDGRHPDGVIFGGGLEQDLARRDFTVNAMALGEGGEIIDPFGGQADLRAGRLRCVGEPDVRFGEDALRMFRAVRFAAQLGFELPGSVAGAIRRNAGRAARLSAERVRTELEKTLLSPRPEMAGVFFELGLMERWAGGRPGALDRLTGLPCQRLPRWAGLSGALLRARAVSGAEAFLRELRLDGGTVRACAAGEELWREGLPQDERGWRYALARFGTGGCRAAAAMEGPEPLAALERVLETGPCVSVAGLALTGGELAAMGLSGPAIGAAQRRLLDRVLECPQDNRNERLRELLREL